MTKYFNIFIFLLFLICRERFVFAKKDKRSLNEIYKSAESFITTNDYVHRWIPMPPLNGFSLEGEEMTLELKKDSVNIILFVSSWSIPSQEIILELLALTEEFKDKPVEFMYVFTHDLPKDAKEFSEDYKIKNAMIASSKLLELYHNPSLPTIYIGDRNGWILTRVIKPSSKDLRRVSKIVHSLSSF